jgi:VIT1/CCC1 family predicted Fe2+/Mn2+ transporter
VILEMAEEQKTTEMQTSPPKEFPNSNDEENEFDPDKMDVTMIEHHYSHRGAWLRAAILGANDGLVSVASLMMGIGGGTSDRDTLILAGLSGLVGGSLSMAVGELISVYAQRDTEKADLAKEKAELEKDEATRARELKELAAIYVGRGLSKDLALQVAQELTAKDALRAHAQDELGIDMDDLANPWQAAGASALSFVIGAVVPLLAGAFWSTPNQRVISLLVFVCAALFVSGGVGAHLGGAPRFIAGMRTLIGGAIAMGITYGVGKLFGAPVEG